MHPGSLWTSAFLAIACLAILAGGLISLLAAIQLSSLLSQERQKRENEHQFDRFDATD